MTGDFPGERIFLSLGSNSGDRERNLREAVRMLTGFTENTRVSSIYATAPLFVLDQPYFLNAVVCCFTSVGLRDLLTKTQDIERAMGRDMGLKRTKEARIIDIDILLYGASVNAEDDLSVPHPGIVERLFVLVPLLELDPDLTEPGSGKPYSAYAENVKNQQVRLYKSW